METERCEQGQRRRSSSSRPRTSAGQQQDLWLRAATLSSQHRFPAPLSSPRPAASWAPRAARRDHRRSPPCKDATCACAAAPRGPSTAAARPDDQTLLWAHCFWEGSLTMRGSAWPSSPLFLLSLSGAQQCQQQAAASSSAQHSHTDTGVHQLRCGTRSTSGALLLPPGLPSMGTRLQHSCQHLRAEGDAKHTEEKRSSAAVFELNPNSHRESRDPAEQCWRQCRPGCCHRL